MPISEERLRELEGRDAHDLAKRDICPICYGELDTGWECNDCGFDARPLVLNYQEPPSDAKPS